MGILMANFRLRQRGGRFLVEINTESLKEAIQCTARLGVQINDVGMISVDLSGMDLHGLCLEGSHLIDADLSGISAPHAKMAGSNLIRACLSSAYLDNADLSDSNLSSANMRNIIIRSGNLTGANMSCADMTKGLLSEAKLTGARLIGAIMDDAKLSNADMTSADCTGAKMRGTNMVQANLTKVNFTGATLSNVDMQDTKCVGADFSGAHLIDADLSGADITNAQFAGTIFTGTKMHLVTGNPAPEIKGLNRAILDIIENRDKLSEDEQPYDYGFAGLVVHVAKDDGASLLAKFGLGPAAALIYGASYPDMPIPDFHNPPSDLSAYLYSLMIMEDTPDPDWTHNG
jgi:uncharacterized protein YjbI with pentapeptide repeats